MFQEQTISIPTQSKCSFLCPLTGWQTDRAITHFWYACGRTR